LEGKMSKFKADTYREDTSQSVPENEKGFRDGDDPEPDDAPGEWGLHIVRTANGYIAAGVDEPGAVFVFEEDDDCPDDHDPHTSARLLNFILDYFDLRGDQFGPNCVSVAVGPGDEYEGPTPIEN
jgi:hypothetical protein